MANQFGYIYKYTKYPVYQNTDITFFSDTKPAYDALLNELDKAEKFIFMEYYAIEDALSFKKIKEILAKKASCGVEVRIMYDDMGSIGFLTPDFIKDMEALGIKCKMFNPIEHILKIFMNNRDHRKLTVIDGRVGFTGGYNLADRYFNINSPYGYWKDTGVMLKGDAVCSLTIMFLEMWNMPEETDADYKKYICMQKYKALEKGYVQPYADTPLDNEYVGENVYLNMAKASTDYYYITTPYLIISDEMKRELCLAAQRGVDVRIITPGIPDKKVIFKITRSYYVGLVKKGVRIYEYTPGFLHAKQTLSDDISATVGTINFDFRSLYHHFENGVLMYDCDAINEIKADFQDLFEASEEVTEKYLTGRNTGLKIGQCILRLFSPLL